MDNRLWPRDLAALLGSPNCVPMEPSSYLQACPNCGGAQMMMVYQIQQGPMRFPSGKCKWMDLGEGREGWYTGQMHVAPCPACCGGQMRQYIESHCGLSGIDLEVSLSDFRTSGSLRGKQEALDTARKLLGMNASPRGFVTFLGEYGVGKSHLMKALVNGFRQVDVVARYATLADLLASIREKFGEDRGARRTEEIIDDFKGVRVLCVDEVDKLNLTAWTKETVFRLIDARYREQGSLLTVLATNTAPESLPVELGYLGSRMRGGIIVTVPGPDMRAAMGVRAKREMEVQ